MTNTTTTLPPKTSERRAVEAFESTLRAYGEPQARLRNLINVTKKGN